MLAKIVFFNVRCQDLYLLDRPLTRTRGFESLKALVKALLCAFLLRHLWAALQRPRRYLSCPILQPFPASVNLGQAGNSNGSLHTGQETRVVVKLEEHLVVDG